MAATRGTSDETSEQTLDKIVPPPSIEPSSWSRRRRTRRPPWRPPTAPLDPFDPGLPGHRLVSSDRCDVSDADRGWLS